MTHPQAFHTSCREGLSSNPGFQFNAASRSLDRSLLSRLAAAHAGYHVPRDMPLEPDAGDLALFPVALKVAAVEGVGTVVSRTRYVGREFRGRNGEPDEGRFGNYFTHIVVGDGAEPFDGLLGIELWEAAHWTDRESDDRALPDLERLVPGPLDPERVAHVLATARDDVRAAVLDAAVAALDGGPRVVIVEPDIERAAAWIGWISYALPAAQARRLTFTTFDGRPRYADDVHVCVTTPGCDIAFAQHELGSSVRLVDVAAPIGNARPSLYARVAMALAARGTDALATAVRAVPADAGGARRGAHLAVAGTLTELVQGDELAAVVDLLGDLAGSGRVTLAAVTATELPADAATDRAAVAEWAALHRTARDLPADEDSRTLAAAALARIVAFAGELPDTVAPVAHGTPTQPGVANLAPWLGAVEAVAGTAASGALISGGVTLGLLGVNTAVDRRIARALSLGLEHPDVQAVLRTIGRERAFDHIVVAITEALAERAGGDPVAREHLRKIAPHTVARATLRRRAEEERTFERVAFWLQAEVAGDPSLRRSAAGELAALARTPADEAEIRELWGTGGPADDAGHVELLSAWLGADAQPPLADTSRALAELMRKPLTSARATDPLGATLRRCDEQVRGHASYRAWWVATTRPGVPHAFAHWAAVAGSAIAAPAAQLPDDRMRELCPHVCLEVLRQRRARDYEQGIAALRSRARDHVDDWLVYVLAEQLRDSETRAELISELWRTWRSFARGGTELVDDVLMRATEGIKRRDLEDVTKHLPERLWDEWAAWMESRPRSAVARAFGLRGRRGKDGDEG